MSELNDPRLVATSEGKGPLIVDAQVSVYRDVMAWFRVGAHWRSRLACGHVQEYPHEVTVLNTYQPCEECRAVATAALALVNHG